MPRHRALGTEGPQLLRGKLFVLRRRCGKPTCHCASGEAHETPALAYPVAGRTNTVTLAHANLAEVRASLARYEAARAELDAAADAGIAALRRSMAASRDRRQV
jgi:hypothetical protein